MDKGFLSELINKISELKNSGLFKDERIITSPQGADISLQDGSHVLNFCANNYLGLGNHPAIIEAAKKGLDEYGFGLSSVRFICGTTKVHKELEARLTHFLGTEDTILYSSCFDANGGLFETILGPDDAVISDELNHASIIDGVRLCKAKRFRYKNNNMQNLEEQLKEAEGCHYKLIITDGVFSMDGILADLHAVCDLADKYHALVAIDDSHAVGFMGENGKGTHEYCGVLGRIDIITGTLGKAMGGASGGYTSGRKEIIDWLRQRSRPYLFSNTLSPSIAKASLSVLDLLEQSSELREKLKENSAYFRKKMTDLGFTLVSGDHPIIPVMLGDAKVAGEMADRLLKHGIYVISFSYPVVPKDQARIRTQISAAHSKEDIDKAVEAFSIVGREMEVIK